MCHKSTQPTAYNITITTMACIIVSSRYVFHLLLIPRLGHGAILFLQPRHFCKALSVSPVTDSEVEMTLHLVARVHCSRRKPQSHCSLWGFSMVTPRVTLWTQQESERCVCFPSRHCHFHSPWLLDKPNRLLECRFPLPLCGGSQAMHYIKVVSKTWNLTLPFPKLHVANENKENTWLRISLSHSEHLRRSQSIFLTSSSLAMAM